MAARWRRSPVVSGIDPVESYRVLDMDMVVYTDSGNIEHSLAPLEPLSLGPSAR